MQPTNLPAQVRDVILNCSQRFGFAKVAVPRRWVRRSTDWLRRAPRQAASSAGRRACRTGGHRALFFIEGELIVNQELLNRPARSTSLRSNSTFRWPALPTSGNRPDRQFCCEVTLLPFSTRSMLPRDVYGNHLRKSSHWGLCWWSPKERELTRFQDQVSPTDADTALARITALSPRSSCRHAELRENNYTFSETSGPIRCGFYLCLPAAAPGKLRFFGQSYRFDARMQSPAGDRSFSRQLRPSGTAVVSARPNSRSSRLSFAVSDSPVERSRQVRTFARQACRIDSDQRNITCSPSTC
jgi:hypothetical protein